MPFCLMPHLASAILPTLPSSTVHSFLLSCTDTCRPACPYLRLTPRALASCIAAFILPPCAYTAPLATCHAPHLHRKKEGRGKGKRASCLFLSPLQTETSQDMSISFILLPAPAVPQRHHKTAFWRHRCCVVSHERFMGMLAAAHHLPLPDAASLHRSNKPL